MKEFTNVKSGGVILTLLLLALVSGSVWGQETVLLNEDFAEIKEGNSTSTSGSNSDWKGNSNFPKVVAAYQAGGSVRLGASKKVGSITTKPLDLSGNGGVFKVSFAVKGWTNVEGDIEVSLSGGKTQTVNYSANMSGEFETVELSFDGGTAQSTLTFATTAKRAFLDDIKIYYGETSTTQVEQPEFFPSNGATFVDNLTVTVSCATEGAIIYYTTDGNDPTTVSEVFPTGGLEIAKTTILKAIAVKDGLDNSEVVTATYTKLEPYADIAALKAAGIATVDGVDCVVKLTDAVVTYAEARKAYIQDATAGLCIYGDNTLKAGTTLNGVVQAKLKLYNGLNQLVVSGGEFDEVTVAEGAAIPETEVTLAGLNQNFAKYESMRVKVVDATVTSAFTNKNGEISQGGSTMALWAADTGIQVDVQATVDVVGYPGLHNTTPQLNVLLQEDITVKTAGKTQATLAFEQDAYSVNLGESLIIKATTNSTSPITYSSEDEEIAKVDSEGKVQAGNKTGMVTITATVTENDEFTGATATCTVNVVDPSALPEAKALVAEKDGVYYAMLSSNKISDKKLDTDVVDVLNNKVVKTSETVDFDFYIDESKGTIQTVSGGYVAHIGNSTDLGVDTKKFTWKKESDGYWHSSTNSARVLGLGVSSGNSVFGTYSLSSTTNQFATDMPIVDGYVRNVTSGDYGTICLPYAVAAEDMAGAEFFSIAGKVLKDGEPQSIVLNQVTTLEAGVPYIFSATSDKLIVAYSGKAVAEAGESNGLVGSFEGQGVAEGMYLISAQNKVQLCGKGCKISGNRAYIDMDKVPEHSGEVGVNQRLISFEDATGISETMVEGGLVDVYTLSGVEVRHQVNESEATQGLPQGIYIVNGKKVVVK